MNTWVVLATGLMLFASSCKKDYVEIDRQLIEEYLADNGLTAQTTDEGLYYIIVEEGTGERPSLESTVTVHYQGYTLDGDIFDSSYDRGEKSSFPLYAVIEGWQIGIPLFKEGGKGKLLIPSYLGYGSKPPPGPIGKNEVLIFDIELFTVE